jgi:hypothetical protein
MITKETITLFEYHLQVNNKKRTIESYKIPLDGFGSISGQRSP